MILTYLKWIISEIKYRKVKSLIIIICSFLSVFLASGTYLAFKQYDNFVNVTYAEKIKSLEIEMGKMIKQYKKMTKQLGFNVLILPKDQNMSDFYSDNFASYYMPQYYADTLAQSKSILIQHILPALIQKVHWTEINRDVLIYGVQKENSRIHFPKANKKSPIIEAVHADSIVLGYELWKDSKLRVGDSVILLGNKFYISKNHKQRNNRDDITIWINLKKSQQMFNKEGKINAILALECRCEGAEDKANILNIRKDLAKILPNTQVVEYMSKVIARAETRYESVKVKKESIKNEKAYIESVKNKTFIIIVFAVSVMLMGSLFTIIVITILDIRNRKEEIGQFVLLGFSNRFIVSFLSYSIFTLIFIGAGLGSIGSVKLIQFITPIFMPENITHSLPITIKIPLIIHFAVSLILFVITSFIIMQFLKIEPQNLFREEMK